MKLFNTKLILGVFLLYTCNLNAQKILYSLPDNNSNQKITDSEYILFKPGFKVTAKNGSYFSAFITGGKGEETPNISAPTFPVSPSEGGIADTQGELSVSAMGNANYTIPIALLPGIKNIAPQIALVYNSSSDNGMVGYGWNLQGISSISRISSRLDIDGFVGGVKLNSNDKFSLDGQRLLLDEGTYGRAGSTYRTENYSNLRIEALGEISLPGVEESSPEYFKVTFPDGTQVFYGSSSDSRGVTEWLIKKWKDPQGNYIEYVYEKDQNTTYISKIIWAVNENINTNYSNVIKFYYKQRARSEFAYVQGIKIVNSRILDKVEVTAGGQLFKKYQLIHQTITGNYQRVSSIQEFNANNEAANPVVFTYNDTPNTFGGYEKDKTEALRDWENIKITGDFDGNGYVDIIAGKYLYLNAIGDLGRSGKIYIPELDETNEKKYDFNNPVTINTVTNNKINNFQSILYYGDRNDSGLSIKDIEYANGQKLILKVKDFDKSSNQFNEVYTKEIIYPYPRINGKGNCNITDEFYKRGTIEKKILSGDFNGDGISEILVLGQTDIVYNNYMSIPAPIPSGEVTICQERVVKKHIPTYYIDMNPNSLQNNYLAIGIDLGYDDVIYIADFDGDGKDDIFKINSEGHYTVFTLGKEDKFKELFKGYIPEYSKEKIYLAGDVNGDGKTDLMIPEAEGSMTWYAYISTGVGFEKVRYDNFREYKPSWKGSPSANRYRAKKYYLADLNKDGKSDFIESEYESWTVQPGDRDGRGYIRYFENLGGANKPIFGAMIESVAPRSRYGYENPITLILTDYKNNEKTGNFVFVQADEIWKGAFNKDLRKDILLKKVEEAGNNKISYLDYSPLEANGANNGLGDSNGVYFSSNQEVYPYKEIPRISNMDVVNKISVTSEGKTLYQRFKYFGLTTHTQGLGLLGFKKIARSNWMTDENIVKTSIWSVEEMYPQLGRDGNLFSPLISSWAFKGDNYYLIVTPEDNKLLNKRSLRFLTTEPSPGIHSVLLNYQIEKDFITGTTVTTENQYHDHHNLTQSIVKNGSGTVQTNYTYVNNPGGNGSDYYIGRLVNKTTKSTAYNDTYSTEEKYTYTNNLITQTQKKGHNTDYITESILYDIFGNLVQKTISAPGVASRTIKDEYEFTGRFVVKKTDTDNLSEYFTYNNWGQVLSHTSPLGMVTRTSYDYWGKLRKVIQEGLSSEPLVSYTDYQRTPGGGIKITSYSDQTGDYSSVYKDFFGRDIKVITKGFNPETYISKDIVYDALGRKVKESEPYIYTPTQWNTIEYDDLSRPIKQTTFTGKIVTNAYNGLSTTTKDEVKTQTITKDANGNTIQVVDNGETITYTYYANGTQKTSNYKGHSITTKQDGWGRKIELQDPSVSTIPYTYSYNNYGELLTETTPDGSTVYTYSPTGKILTKTITGTNTSVSAEYEYSDKGLLLKETGTSGGDSYSYTYTYDKLYRLTSQKEITPKVSYLKEYTYDQWGRKNIEKTTTTFGKLSSSVSIQNNYNSYNGIKNNITQVGTGKVLWQITGMNERMQVLTAKLGNNITITNQIDAAGFMHQIDHTGNMSTPLSLSYDFNWKRGTLNSRFNKYYNWNEQFTYDHFDRLVSWSDPNGLNTNQYAPDGRITTNSQVGEYQYHSSARYKKSSINLNVNGKSYYENRPTQQITYNVFKNPVDIVEGNNTIRFTYNIHTTRTRAEISSSQLKTINKYYSDTKEVEIISTVSSGSEEVKIISYISGSPYDAPLIYVSRFSGSVENLIKTEESFYYLHRDYQGTILAISNEQGQTIERRLFDPWGKVIKVTDKNGNTQSENPQFTFIDRGYTGHEHFFTVGLIHMNGRMYDPVLKQFLSPDNNIQEPFNSQNYNRYGYVLNNPLMYTDPSGEIFGLSAVVSGVIIGAFLSGATYTAYALYTDTFSWGGFTKGILTGGVTGALGGVASLYAPIGILPGAGYGAITGGVIDMFGAAISGGDIVKGGLLGAVTGGIMGGVMGGIEAHKLKGNLWTGYRAPEGTLVASGSLIEGSTPVEHTTAAVNKLYEENFKDLINADMTFYKVNEGTGAITLDKYGFKGYKTDISGNIIGPDGKLLGVTRSSIWNHGNKYKIFFSSEAFSSKEQLSLVLAHELGHVKIFQEGLSGIALQKIVQGKTDLIDNVGHQAIQKMTYNFLNTNGWLNLNLNGQATKSVLENWMLQEVNGAIYNTIKSLGNVKIK